MWGEAKADVIGGTTVTSGIIILDIVKDVMPMISIIGVVAGTILAIHGCYELFKSRYWPWIKGKIKHD